MKIWSIIKLVIISVVALVGLTLLTVDAPQKMEKKEIIIQNLPQSVELIGFEEQKFATKSIIQPESFIFVGNYESIVLSKKLDELLNLPNGQLVIVSNVSDAPWFIKRWQAHNQNIKLKGEKHLPWIYDRDGAIRNFLQVPTSDGVKYFVYHVQKDGKIKNIYIGKVKQGTIDGAMSEEEIHSNLAPLIEKIQTLRGDMNEQ